LMACERPLFQSRSRRCDAESHCDSPSKGSRSVGDWERDACRYIIIFEVLAVDSWRDKLGHPIYMETVVYKSEMVGFGVKKSYIIRLTKGAKVSSARPKACNCRPCSPFVRHVLLPHGNAHVMDWGIEYMIRIPSSAGKSTVAINPSSHRLQYLLRRLSLALTRHVGWDDVISRSCGADSSFAGRS
jgi:hypothetical protein